MSKLKMLLLLVLTTIMLMGFTATAAVGEYPYIFNDEILFFGVDKPVDVLDGIVYAPIELYIDKLGFSKVYDGVTKSLAIFLADGERSFSFNMTTYVVITSDGRFPIAKTYFQNKSFYIPMEFFMTELGVQFSVLEDGTIRVTTGKQTLTDGEMMSILASMPETYTETENPSVFLEIQGISKNNTQRILTTLDKYNVKANFFATSKEIMDNPDVVREIFIDGHTLGIYTDELSVQNALNEVERANRLLTQVLKRRTVFVLHPDASDAHRQSFSRKGYITWGSNLERTVEGSGSNVNNVLRSVKWPVALLIRNDTVSANALSRILTTFPRERFVKITEPYKTIH